MTPWDRGAPHRTAVVRRGGCSTHKIIKICPKWLSTHDLRAKMSASTLQQGQKINIPGASRGWVQPPNPFHLNLLGEEA